MGGITEKITEFIKDLLTGWITSNLDTMFTDVNTKVETIATEVGKTPQNWNSGIFSMIKNLSDNVIVPIAGMIITFVLCYELISMIMEKNNMHDTDTFMFFKYIFKMWVAVYLVTHTFDIAMAIFDVRENWTILCIRPQESPRNIIAIYGDFNISRNRDLWHHCHWE